MSLLTLAEIEGLITSHEDFPSAGVLFRDIFPILQSPSATRSLVAHLVDWIKATAAERHVQVDVVVGLDARGFLFGPMIAQALQARFVPVRKQGKLPGKVLAHAYKKEYGTDVFEMHEGAITPGQNVVIFDDLIATGGSAAAAAALVQASQGNLLAALFVIELTQLNGARALPDNVKVHALYKY